MAATMNLARRCSSVKAATPCHTARPRLVAVRAVPQDNEVQPATPPAAEVPTMSAQGTATVPLLGSVQERLNGRAAMLGFVSAVVAEGLTHQSVWSQLVGRYVDLELVEKPVGIATLLYFAIVFLVTVGTLVPKLVDDVEPGSQAWGPFTPGRELAVGRIAMMGFLGLLAVELLKGSSLF